MKINSQKLKSKIKKLENHRRRRRNKSIEKIKFKWITNKNKANKDWIKIAKYKNFKMRISIANPIYKTKIWTT